MIEEPCTGIPPRTNRCAQLDVIANSLPVIVAPRCSRGIIGWSVMRSRVRFSEGLRPKADAASTIRSGRGIDARVRSGDSVRGPPPGLPWALTSFSVLYELPTHEKLRQRRRSRLARASLVSTAM